MPARITEDQARAILEVRSSLMFDTWQKIVNTLTLSEDRTLLWVNLTLRSSIDVTKIGSFHLPLEGRIKMIYKNFYKEAYSLGGQAVFDSTNGDSAILFVGKSNVFVNAKARISAERIVTSIEEKLKWEWERSMTRVVDQSILTYRTKAIFAKAGGWRPPDGPNS